MKTLLVRPVLVESKERTNLWSYKGRRLYYNQANFNDEDETAYYRAVLVSLDPNDKIERGNKVVTNNVDYFATEIQLCTMSEFLDSDNIIKFGINNQIKVYKFGYNKVIATQDQLSPDLMQKLVDEYNNGGMQNFEIEMDWILGDKEDENQNLIPVLQPKLTNNFITIVEKEHNFPYPEEPMEEDGELVYLDRPIGKPLEDYINQKHSQDRCMSFIDGYEARRLEESNSYTPQDLLEVMNLGMSLRQSQLNGSDSRSGNEVLYQWMQNKKEIISKTTCKSEIE